VVVEKVNIIGVNALKKTLIAVDKSTKNLKPYWNMAKSIIWKNTAARFKKGGGSRGKWAPLTYATIQLRRFNKTRAAPLQDQGLLLKSVTTQESVKKETPKVLIIGTNLDYGEAQQHGYKMRVTPSMRRFFIARGLTPGPLVDEMIEVPARPFLYIDKADREQLDKALKFYFTGTLRRSAKGGT